MLDETVHIVTGGGGGLGTASAKELASHGATVVVNDLNSDEDDSSATAVVDEIIKNGGDAEAHYGDITNLDYAERIISETAQKYGRIDGVVNFAGVLRDSYLTDMSGEEWDQVINVHLRGHFALLRAAGQHWKKINENTEQASSTSIGPRSFLTVSSPSIHGNPGQANYSAAKTGVLGLMRTAAAELQRFGVRVNALIPVAYTQMTESFLDPEEYPVEKVAPVVAYLLSNKSDSVTGCTVQAAGDGVSLYSNPQVERMAFNEGGWDLETLADRFEKVLGKGVDLNRSETPRW